MAISIPVPPFSWPIDSSSYKRRRRDAALTPTGLSLPEIQVYWKLIRVARRLKKSGQKPRPVVVVTDVGKDYDDLAALTVLKELHRLRLIELRAVVANLMPADKRACLARAALDSLGLGPCVVPVARGTRGSPDEDEELAYEFSGSGFVATPDQCKSSQRDGQDLLFQVYRTAEIEREKLYLLCLSSLQDINEFAYKHPTLVAENTAEVHMQGGNYISEEGNLEPDSKAANNRFNLDAAKKFHSFIQTTGIPSHTYTKIAAFAAPLTSKVFEMLEATGHPIGAFLRRVQVEQDLAFYQRACERDPKKRFAPFMDQEWFLAHKTSWHQRVNREGNALPTGKEIIPFLTKLVLYDVHAALGVAGKDVQATLNYFQGKDRCIEVYKEGNKVEVYHRIYGDDQSVVVPREVNGVEVALSALMKGSLLALKQPGFSSENIMPLRESGRKSLNPMILDTKRKMAFKELSMAIFAAQILNERDSFLPWDSLVRMKGVLLLVSFIMRRGIL